MALQITPHIENDMVVLDLEGRLWVLDLSLREHVRALLEQGCRYFVFNLEHVDYVDSSGLGQLVALWTSVRSKDGNVCLLRPSPRVERLLKVTQLNVIFDTFHDEGRAKLAVRRDS